jgi:DNA repair exonuclease SbcCD nuclease subunit
MVFTQVIHLSDLHIRRGVRFEEYRGVFEQLISQVTELPSVQSHQALAVITGDVFHDKGNTEPTGIDLFYYIIDGLSRLMPTIVIAGNHDIRQDDSSASDLIDVLLKRSTNVHYLKTSGLYEFDNIGIGCQVIQDVLDIGATTGLSTNMLPFPDPSAFSERVTTKLALCHIAIDEVCGRFRTAPVIDSSHFKGYDAVLLGDIHKQQIGKGTKDNPLTWAYPGSLIQQNFGENLLHHGFLLWDVSQIFEPRAVDVPNKFGLVTALWKTDGVHVAIDDGYAPLTKAAQWIPRHISLRIRGDDAHDFKAAFAEYGINVSCSTTCYYESNKRKNSGNDGTDDDAEMDGMFINSSTMWAQHIKDKLPAHLAQQGVEYLLNTNTFLQISSDANIAAVMSQSKLEGFAEKCLYLKQQRDTINGEKGDTFGRHAPKHSFSLCTMQWQWLLCFGQDNRFDFDKLIGNIVLLNGKNASGKSNFVDVIFLALFGQCVPSRTNKHFSIQTVHVAKPPKSPAQVQLSISLGSHTYTIMRKFNVRNTGGVKCIVMDTVLTGDELVHPLKNTAANNWIKENIGTPQDFFLSCVLTQYNDMDFFTLKDNERSGFLDKAFNLGAISTTMACIKDTLSIYKQVANDCQVVMNEYMSKMELNKGGVDYEHSKGRLSILTTETQKVVESLAAARRRMENERTQFSKDDVAILVDYEGALDNNITEAMIRETEDATVSLTSEHKTWSSCGVTATNNTSDMDGGVRPSFSVEYFKELSRKLAAFPRPPKDTQTQCTTNLDYETLQEQYMHMQIVRPTAVPRETQESIDHYNTHKEAILSDVADWTCFIDHLDALAEARTIQVEIDNILTELKADDHDRSLFNPDCWACQQQPWHTRRKALTQRLDSLTYKIKLILPNPEHMLASYPAFVCWYDEYKNITKERDEYFAKQHQILGEVNEWQIKNDECLAQTMQAKSDEAARRWHSLNTEYIEKKGQIEIWLSHLQQELRISEDKLQMYKYEYRLRTSKPHYDAYVIAQEDVRVLDDTACDLRVEMAMLTNAINKLQEDTNRHELVCKVHEQAQKTVDVLSALYKCFEGDKHTTGVKDWLQRERVVPFLMSRINPLLACFGITLNISYDAQRYDFLVSDTGTGTIVSIEKSSGFQRFAISFAMRVAFSQIGAAHIIPTQLLLDEGFTTCDTTNIHKMPSMVRYFMKHYKTIYIISHLDTIRDAADVQYTFTKNDGVTSMKSI